VGDLRPLRSSTSALLDPSNTFKSFGGLAPARVNAMKARSFDWRHTSARQRGQCRRADSGDRLNAEAKEHFSQVESLTGLCLAGSRIAGSSSLSDP